jgi:hypothetical protein
MSGCGEDTLRPGVEIRLQGHVASTAEPGSQAKSGNRAAEPTDPAAATRGSGVVEPLSPEDGYGLPPRNLSLGIAVHGNTAAGDWSGSWLERAVLDTGGAIYFTNNGTSRSKRYYPEGGGALHFRAIHPWEGAQVVSTPWGERIDIPMDGSDDVMVSDAIASGSELSPELDPIRLRHTLVRLNIRLLADGPATSELYGDIEEVGVAFQPASVLLSLADGTIEGDNEVWDTVYPAVGFTHTAGNLLPTTVRDYGYVLAAPFAWYSVRVQTQYRRSFYSEFQIPAQFNDPETGAPRAGTAFDVTMRFRAAGLIVLDVTPVETHESNTGFD